MMFPKLSAAVIACILSFPVVRAAESDRVIEVRAVLQDPLGQGAELFVPDKAGGVEKLRLVPKNLPTAQKVRTVNGALLLLRSADADPAEPGDQLLGSARIPSTMKRAIALVFPRAAGSKQRYNILLFDDSTARFPKGASRLINATPTELAIKVGEHKLGVKPGKTILVPPVTRKDAFNMAQTSVFYHKGDAWIPFVERKLKYVDTYRRIFIAHVTPGATDPSMSTIVDIAPVPVPEGDSTP